MDEYFCPNCGAILNDQYGFDSNGGSWTCTACGMHLMDDDVYDGEKVKGVAWYCDNCGELLNRQSGFSDSIGSWRCTNCGHLNGTTEDDIINIDPQCPSCSSYLKSQLGYSKDYDDWTCEECGAKLHWDYSCDSYEVVYEDKGPECPNCGRLLKSQLCYSEYEDDWTCEECGAKLHRDYSWGSYEVVHEDKGAECPNCGSSLKKQFFFSDICDDHICSECGKKLHRRCSRDPFEVVEEDNGPQCPSCGAYLKEQYSFSESCCDYTCDKCGAKLHRDCSFDPFEVILDDEEDNGTDDGGYTPPLEYQSQKVTGKGADVLRRIRMKAFFLKRKKIVLGFDSHELLHKNIDFVRISLHNQAFNSITAVPIKDIDNESPYSVGEVEQVLIGGSQHFHAEDMIAYDTQIFITYHEKKEIALPFSARYFHRKNFTDVVDQLQTLGFTEICERPIKDLTTGWIIKDGSIEKVTVGGNDTFKKSDVYVYDTKIVIEYHTFKK